MEQIFDFIFDALSLYFIAFLVVVAVLAAAVVILVYRYLRDGWSNRNE